MQRKPYVGVTSPVSIPDVVGVLNAFGAAGFIPVSTHRPMIGFVVSPDTLDGHRHSGGKSRRYPQVSRLPALLKPTVKKLFTTIHYNVEEPKKLAYDVQRIFGEKEGLYDEELCKGLQFNIDRDLFKQVTVDQVSRVKEIYPDMEMIIQLSDVATPGMSDSEIVDNLLGKYSFVDHVLIDNSRGSGKQLTAPHAVKLYKLIRERNEDIGIGFAGGLSADNVRPVVRNLVSELETNEFSIDAESGLRDENDSMDIKKVEEYLELAFEALEIT